MVGRDPTLPSNQKTVYALQEDRSAIPIQQPVLTSAGGVTVYNGSPIIPAVSGAYSLTILDSEGSQKYYYPHVTAPDLNGYSGVIAEESQEVAGSLDITFTDIDTTTASFYKSANATGSIFEGVYLKIDVDYLRINDKTIRLLTFEPDGTVILARQMDPTGQIIPVVSGTSALFVFQDIAAAKEADLQPDDTITINGGVVAGDKLGGSKYICVLGQPEADDGENNINLNNGNQIKLIENNFRLARYAEVTTDSVTTAGQLNLDLSKGNVHELVLTENTTISNASFINANPDPNLTTTVSLKITNDPAVSRSVTYSGILWAGGTPPVKTPALNSVDEYIFKSRGGSVWTGYVVAEDVK